MHIKQIIVLPNTLYIIIIDFRILLFIHKKLNRNNPYLPNFNKIAAKNIEPTTGASTWAFGSHWWTPYIGNFTKKAIHTGKKFIVEFKVIGSRLLILFKINTLKINLFVWKNHIIIINNNGKEAVTV